MPINRNLAIAITAMAVAIFLGLCGCGLAFAFWSRSIPPGPTITRDVEFTGHFTSSFEVSSFVPCAPETPVPGYFSNAYWVSSTPESGFYDRYIDVTGTPRAQQPAGKTVYVHIIGDLSPEGEHGHLGGYSHEITVTQVLEMSLEGTC